MKKWRWQKIGLLYDRNILTKFRDLEIMPANKLVSLSSSFLSPLFCQFLAKPSLLDLQLLELEPDLKFFRGIFWFFEFFEKNFFRNFYLPFDSPKISGAKWLALTERQKVSDGWKISVRILWKIKKSYKIVPYPYQDSISKNGVSINHIGR